MPEGRTDRRAIIAGAGLLVGAAAASAIWDRLRAGSRTVAREIVDPGLAGWMPSPSTGPPHRLAVTEVDITPGHGVSMTGYGYQPRLSNGRCARRLRAQCALLRDPDGRVLVLVRADVGALTYDVYRSIVDTLVTEKIIAGRADFMLNISHTHSGPALGLHPDPRVLTHLPEDGLPGVQEVARAFTANVLELVRAAHRATAVPVTLGHATGSASVGITRWTSEAASPTELPVLVARHAETGKLEAIIYSYPCHPVCRGNDAVFDADFCGVASTMIANEMRAPAFYLQGTGGDIDPAGQGHGETRVHFVGAALAEAVVKTVREATFTRLRSVAEAWIEEVELPFAPDLSRHAVVSALRERYHERILTIEEGPTKAGAVRRHAELMVRLIDEGRLPRGLEMTVQRWDLGGLRIVALSHEVVHQYTTLVRRMAGAEGVWVLGYTNHVESYLPTDAGLRSGGYAAGWNEASGRHFPGEAGSVMAYGWPAPLRSTLDATPELPGSEGLVLDRVARLMRAG
ncbi:MAG TPA: hypothetical protein VF062_04790 [Candidatus Limnocylindrales bacterium]